MTPPTIKYRVASVQASPVFFDSTATILKTVELIQEAAVGGASLVVFPELWVSSVSFHIVHEAVSDPSDVSSSFVSLLTDPWVRGRPRLREPPHPSHRRAFLS